MTFIRRNDQIWIIAHGQMFKYGAESVTPSLLYESIDAYKIIHDICKEHFTLKMDQHKHFLVKLTLFYAVIIG